ncbi:tRNA pseudouridine(38-40) synthase TruA [Nonomuraea sp. NPDC052129]|uniref:tRNA pseudouridine(38-40) synthase TruA n=1 Tax=Nonomuraea sp. NPDC052129 TaxID=3154651 RepID=UPI0034351CD9
MVVRLRLDLGYDGTDFSGWARQPGLRTVQGEIEQALGRILRLAEPPALTVAGRTDAGVHARGQAAHVDLPVEAFSALDRNHRRSAEHEPAAVSAAGFSAVGSMGGGAVLPLDVDERLATLLRRLAGVLESDVRVHRVSVASEGFDARFSALSRRYAYRVSDAAGGVDPLRRREVVWHNRPLDLDALNAAATHLLGEHDFAAFCKKREGATTIRRLQRLDWVREGDRVLVATVVADAFCHSMVRSLVGSLLSAADGRRPVEWPGQVLGRAVRDSGVHVAPAHGLCLEEVTYPPDAELAARALATRRVRTLGDDPPAVDAQ